MMQLSIGWPQSIPVFPGAAKLVAHSPVLVDDRWDRPRRLELLRTSRHPGTGLDLPHRRAVSPRNNEKYYRPVLAWAKKKTGGPEVHRWMEALRLV